MQPFKAYYFDVVTITFRMTDNVRSSMLAHPTLSSYRCLVSDLETCLRPIY